MFGRKIEPLSEKEWSHSVFSPLHRIGVSLVQLMQLPDPVTLAHGVKIAGARCAVRLHHEISPEYSSSRHIFLKYAASAKTILRFELSHKSGSNFFQNSADFLDKKGRAAYVLEHRMRTACVHFGPPLTRPYFSVSANQRECVMYDITNCIASVRVACSCRETIKGKAHTALCRM
ncbi:hypothetical protein [Shinella sp. NM-101]|uniref:hypothetical protein n=1 Tax=Shinella sp. NM-101 TaxID=2744455 RepID=UPI001F443554|nr:hypothetical protein [Shinella sp. NM-101]